MPLTNLNKKYDRRERYSYHPQKKGNKAKRIFTIILILFIALAIPSFFAYQSAKKLSFNAKRAAEGFKNGNFAEVKLGVDEMKNASSALNLSVDAMIWVRVIPFLGDYYGDARHFAKAGNNELRAAQKIVDIIEPSKNELGLNGAPMAGPEKIAQMGKIMDKVIPELDKISPELKKASDEVKSIKVEKYPEKVGKYNVRSLVDTGKNFIMGASVAATDHKEALQVAPRALGQPDPKNYLLIFQNDKEIRATGGFMTAYAFLKLDKGKVDSSQSDDIYHLDEKLLDVCLRKICPLAPPEPLVKYLPEADGKPRQAWSLRDANLSPDVPTSMKQFEKMYSFIGEGTPWDGIILIDTHVVEELIKITGPIEVYGTTYSAENDNRCNCPNVIFELENYAQIIERGEKDRKAILGALMQQILAKSLETSTEKMPEFINVGVKLANSKNMLFYMHDQKTQDALAKLNWTGQIKEVGGDYLHINDSNFAGGKSNLYVEEKVELDINIKDGKVKNKLTIEYKNPSQPKSWLNNVVNRDYIRVYVPMGAKLSANKGSDAAVQTKDELGKTYFDAFIQVRPANSRVISFEYELPNSFSGKEYPLLIQKQPGSKDFEYTVKVNGKQKAKFNLDSDKELKLSI